ncbi:MAG: 50S ribosomal protein L29 [Thaumarchaeota archaeon]|nr:50S ribosomal protein L29 [Nitrososphaerota archaeon]
MSRLKSKELRKMDGEERGKKVAELRAELSKLKAGVARGTVRKEVGQIAALKKNIARILTVINEPKGESS